MKVPIEPFLKVAATQAAEICGRVELSEEAASLVSPELSPQGLLALLIENDHTDDAIRCLAFALPAREAVWWACVTARSSTVQITKGQKICLDRATTWVYDPTDARRRVCMDASEQVQHEGAAAYAALAAFWSGGSLAPEGMPEVPPDPNLAAIAVGASVLLELTAGDPDTFRERFEATMQRGIDIANGGNGNLESDRPPEKGQ